MYRAVHYLAETHTPACMRMLTCVHTHKHAHYKGITCKVPLTSGRGRSYASIDMITGPAMFQLKNLKVLHGDLECHVKPASHGPLAIVMSNISYRFCQTAGFLLKVK